MFMGIGVKRCFSGWIVGVMLCLLLPAAAQAADRSVTDVRLWAAPDHTRVVFDLNHAIDYRVFRLSSPERIVVDMRGVSLHARLAGLAAKGSVVRSFRYGKPKGGVLRIVMDVGERVQPRSFLLKPMQGKPYRLVVDLMRRNKPQDAPITADQVRSHKVFTIAVDAGHGGEDPGATGPDGLHEKDVTLAIAKRLARAINKQPGMRAVLTRKGDYFVPLQKRVRLVRKAKANLMISIHADSVHDRHVSGASVYMLSEKGASDHMAAMLARKENAADAIGGVMPGQVEDPMVNRILADLVKRDTLNSSELLAEDILKQIRRIGPIKYGVPKRARFVVLGAPEIPSVLVEVDYISNPHRERLLRSPKHRQQLAAALLDASEAYLRRQGRLKKVTHRAGRGHASHLIATTN